MAKSIYAEIPLPRHCAVMSTMSRRSVKLPYKPPLDIAAIRHHAVMLYGGGLHVEASVKRRLSEQVGHAQTSARHHKCTKRFRLPQAQSRSAFLVGTQSNYPGKRGG